MNIEYVPAVDGDPAFVLDHDNRAIIMIDDWTEFERQEPLLAAEVKRLEIAGIRKITT
jgi:hypothetical protein